jgi:hypothetical protein
MAKPMLPTLLRFTYLRSYSTEVKQKSECRDADLDLTWNALNRSARRVTPESTDPDFDLVVKLRRMIACVLRSVNQIASA